jgi:hypothetical protein
MKWKVDCNDHGTFVIGGTAASIDSCQVHDIVMKSCAFHHKCLLRCGSPSGKYVRQVISCLCYEGRYVQTRETNLMPLKRLAMCWRLRV